MNMTPRNMAKNIEERKKNRSAAIPVTFAGTVGLYMPAGEPGYSSPTSVLIVGAWGFEEMCSRKFWRILADDLADRGVSSLRFDFPGTGDALDGADFSGGLDLWHRSISQAAAELRYLSGCESIIVLALGLGVPLALEAAGTIDGITAFGLLAPVLSGRTYLREISVWARMIEDNLGMPEDQRVRDGVAIASLHMPDEVAAAVRQINITDDAQPPKAQYLLLGRQGRPADARFAETLKANGSTVETQIFDGYEQMISNVTYARPPLADIARIAAWVDTVKAPLRLRAAPAPVSAQPLSGDGFRETPVRFGKDDRLYGVLCEPSGPRTGATLVIVNTAYERHSSWGRLMTTLAREMAGSGIASLRFDGANIADSPPLNGAPEQVLYDSSQEIDVAEATAFLDARLPGPMVAVGRCSGGYVAFRGAVQNESFSGAVLINPFAFYFNRSESVEDLLKFVPKSLASYGPKAMRLETWKRIASGDVKLKHAVVNTVKALSKKAVARLSPYLKSTPFAPREFREVEKSFARLEARNVALSLVYTEGDVGLTHLEHHFGAQGAGLKQYGNIAFKTIANADHNLTPPAARRIFHDEVRKMALRFSPKSS